MLEQSATEQFEPLLKLHLPRRVRIRNVLQFRDNIHDLNRLRCSRPTEPILMKNVTGHGKEVSGRISDRFMVVDAQQTQVHLLREVRHVRGGISQTRGQVAPQLPPVGLLKRRQERIVGVARQNCLVKAISKLDSTKR
jgi:hypothetical protein